MDLVSKGSRGNAGMDLEQKNQKSVAPCPSNSTTYGHPVTLTMRRGDAWSHISASDVHFQAVNVNVVVSALS